MQPIDAYCGGTYRTVHHARDTSCRHTHIRRWSIVEHENYTRHRQNDEQEKRNTAHPPRVTDVGRMTPHGCRMQMKEHIAHNLMHPVRFGVFVTVAKYRPIYL